MNINIKELLQFLARANQAGYASGQELIKQKQNDSSTSITYQDGDWQFHDNYFGGEPYGGREVVFYKDKPVFIMTYYGRISDKTVNISVIYTFLQRALQLFPKDKPFRGPEELIEKIEGTEFKYTNTWKGDITYFSGEEKIHIDNQEVYDAKYAGGLVDQ